MVVVISYQAALVMQRMLVIAAVSDATDATMIVIIFVIIFIIV